MLREFADYPLSAFVDGAKTVWGRLFMIYLALNLPIMLVGVLTYGAGLLYAGMTGALLGFIAGPVFLFVVNLTSFWGLGMNIVIVVLALGYFVSETYQCERFFGMAWLSWLGWTVHFNDFSWLTLVTALIMATLHASIRLWAWWRLKQLDRMTLLPPEDDPPPADAASAE